MWMHNDGDNGSGDCVGVQSRAGSMYDDEEGSDAPEPATLNLGGGSDDDTVSLLAVGTAEGTVEVVSVSQGAVQPLALNIVHSFKVCAPQCLPQPLNFL